MAEIVYIGLGGNIGDVVATMQQALQTLDRDRGISVLEVSPVYRTPPWGKEDQDWFHNACAALSTHYTPGELLQKCLDVEREHKRIRDERWGPRTLDLDILLFGERRVSTETLKIPHPRIIERAFVLKPLCDLLPDFLLEEKTLMQWLEKHDESTIQVVDLSDEWWSLPN